ncbi:fimbrial protein [Neisseriaceae bacterium TC5R-5]|nr:fimbrial protein [Neisseriaceae bacterium TC5R-5]
MCQAYCRMLLLLSTTLLLFTQAWGVCIYSAENGNWDGQSFAMGGFTGLPSAININSLDFQPSGTVLASAVAPLPALSSSALKPEQILFRCAATDVNNLYEYYGTEATNALTGQFEDGGAQVPGGYRSKIAGVLVRLTNTSTGEYFSHTWKRRQLSGLDRDANSLFPILVKVKNFSTVKLEFIRFPNESSATDAFTGSGPLPAPYWNAGYLAFGGPGISSANIDVGKPATWWTVSSPYAYVGSVNYAQSIEVRRTSSCKVNNVTPYVLFPSMSVAQMEAGKVASATINIDFSCQPNASGSSSPYGTIATGTTMMAIAIPSDKANASSSITGLAYGPGGAVIGSPALISDHYGNTGIAQGVAVTLKHQNGQPVAFNWGVKGYDGAWWPILDGATQIGLAGSSKAYRKTLTATFGKIANRSIKVTAGSFNAQAEVLIRVQ